MEQNIKELISKMTLEEKASLCSGATDWETKSIDRFNIPSMMVADGPHGIRKQEGETDNLGIHDSKPATCFPPACAIASSWNTELVTKVGEALGEECQAENIDILLGPGVNIKRSPICGRNFEYFSEDPVLSGEMGVAWVNGVQSQGVGTSLKHYVANNQEALRMSIDTIIEERVLREIYLPAFERVVKRAQPWTVMAAYNRVNGTYVSQNKYLLTDILRDEWGYDGFVISDWGAVDDRVKGLKAGLDFEMPGVDGVTDMQIVEAIKTGKLDESVLDKAVENYLKILFKSIANNREGITYNIEEHHTLARKAASESIVLLKNEDNILPLNKGRLRRIAVIGSFAKSPRYQGGGSSHVNPTKLENAYDEIKNIAGDKVEISYAEGYTLDKDNIDQTLLADAKETAKLSEVTILFVGLPEIYESEGYDREHMNMPPTHLKLIEEVCSVQENVIVVLSNGGVVTMKPWNQKVKGILESWLLGQAGGGAIADILFGNVNPSAKLAETLPIKLSDNPSFLNFPGTMGEVYYKEGVYVGYRYYDAKEMEVAYPFGFGLSYTTFEYSDLQLSKNEILDTEELVVKVKIKNTGNCFGKEVVQLYVRDIECREIRPVKELKSFIKVALQPGEEKEVKFSLRQRDFAFYERNMNDWVVESGEFEILVGKSSQDIYLKEKVNVDSTSDKRKFTRYSTASDLITHPIGKVFVEQMGKQMSQEMVERKEKAESDNSEMVSAMMTDTALCKAVTFSKGAFSGEMLQGLLDKINNS